MGIATTIIRFRLIITLAVFINAASNVHGRGDGRYWRNGMRVTKCRINEHTCDNGDCINLSYLCDGNNDCSDGSDETGYFACDNGDCTVTQGRIV